MNNFEENNLSIGTGRDVIIEMLNEEAIKYPQETRNFFLLGMAALCLLYFFKESTTQTPVKDFENIN